MVESADKKDLGIVLTAIVKEVTDDAHTDSAMATNSSLSCLELEAIYEALFRKVRENPRLSCYSASEIALDGSFTGKQGRLHYMGSYADIYVALNRSIVDSRYQENRCAVIVVGNGAQRQLELLLEEHPCLSKFNSRKVTPEINFKLKHDPRYNVRWQD